MASTWTKAAILGASPWLASVVARPDAPLDAVFERPVRGDYLTAFYAIRHAIAEEHGEWATPGIIRRGAGGRRDRVDPITPWAVADAVSDRTIEHTRIVLDALPEQSWFLNLVDSDIGDFRGPLELAVGEYVNTLRQIKLEILTENKARVGLGREDSEEWGLDRLSFKGIGSTFQLGEALPHQANADFWTATRTLYLAINSLAFIGPDTVDGLLTYMKEEIPNAPGTLAEWTAKGIRKGVEFVVKTAGDVTRGFLDEFGGLILIGAGALLAVRWLDRKVIR